MEIKIKCDYDELMPLETLVSLQGGLKKINPDKHKKATEAILRNGIIFPFYIWDSPEKTYLIDGVNRYRILLELRRKGYTLKGVPVIFIDAAGKDEAKEFILLASSQYAKPDKKGALKFIDGLDWKTWVDEISIAIFNKLDSGKSEKEKTSKGSSSKVASKPSEGNGWKILFKGSEEDEYLSLMEKVRKTVGKKKATEQVIFDAFKIYSEALK